MAKHLILKLLEPNTSWRYTGAQVIDHPWIERNKYDEISLTIKLKQIVKKLLKIYLMLAYC